MSKSNCQKLLNVLIDLNFQVGIGYDNITFCIVILLSMKIRHEYLFYQPAYQCVHTTLQRFRMNFDTPLDSSHFANDTSTTKLNVTYQLV